MEISFRKANKDDHTSLENLRLEAFQPIFTSFKNILGNEIYELAQRKEDEDQSELLSSMFSQNTDWELYIAQRNNETVGFISIQLNSETTVGEIGLNAVKPEQSGKGIGTEMYNFAVARMKDAGMRVATVATGGDESHLPARRAYEKAGFNVQIPSIWFCRKL